MGKSINAKASSAMTKKSGVSKMKTTPVAKKSVKKRVEIDLQQPKDRDPIDSKMVSATQTDEKRVIDDNEAQRMAEEIEAKRIAEREARRSGHYDSIVPIIIITETLIVNMLLYGHSIAGEIFGCKGQVL
ncbi:unnamed protein product [Cylindrotheca closterium]|uniref:Uncharacterized protein n=1 Tax=Cylindrotheca closterium TaxID=2856 RepID=A0AAD2JKM8_9STRA|nr:unnamed protein product [Cylindrotheca closterium]CAJ1959437.1 unnamed protein product [Cylindrotheca closterium]CAJ1959438.1 unnamed protein product [Cylindrotheca closterium]CAJ1959439.1 unnamed protein product [Cylindrotheca closterium]